MKEKIKRFFTSFCIINTGSLLAAFSFIAIFSSGKTIHQAVFWQVLIMAFIITFIPEILCAKDHATKKEYILRSIIIYIFVNISVVCCAYIFKWIERDYLKQTSFLVFTISLVYGFVYLISYKNDKETADEINKRIKEFNNKN